MYTFVSNKNKKIDRYGNRRNPETIQAKKS